MLFVNNEVSTTLGYDLDTKNYVSNVHIKSVFRYKDLFIFIGADQDDLCKQPATPNPYFDRALIPMH